MGIARALGNYIGNCVATVVIASWVGDIDKDRARRILDGQSVSAPDLPVVEAITQNIGKPDPLSRPQM